RAILRSAAALLLRARAAADREAAARRRTARALLDRLVEIDSVHAIAPVDGAEPGYLRLPLRVANGRARSPADAARLGIAPAYPRPLSMLPALRDRLAGPERRFPGAESLASSLITLPTHSAVTPHDVQALVRALRAADEGSHPTPRPHPRPVRAG
ncbi:MAG TPA: DegT/DnrJ/EryC1/StrS family aminotransferase, partial [Longimicrobium sp.]|nr:DegT/DnrJ/EryC1/StrS family aminotransferase [Longimicrobium sp.]